MNYFQLRSNTQLPIRWPVYIYRRAYLKVKLERKKCKKERKERKEKKERKQVQGLLSAQTQPNRPAPLIKSAVV